jgi:hypothetical protein
MRWAAPPSSASAEVLLLPKDVSCSWLLLSPSRSEGDEGPARLVAAVLASDNIEESANEVPMPEALVREDASDGMDRTFRVGLPRADVGTLSSKSIASSEGEARIACAT